MFQSNRFIKIEGLEKLVNLDDLYLSNNGIQQVEGLEHNVSERMLVLMLSYLITFVLPNSYIRF